jgi:hypothetical protein
VFALGPVVSGEALADSGGIVASSTAGAVTTLGIAVSLENIRPGRALDKRAIGATTTKIANATDVLLGVPRSSVSAGSLGGKLFLGEANTGITAGIGAHGSLASNTLVVGKASTFTSCSVTITLVGALYHGMEVVGSLDVTNPSHGLGASAL